MTDITPRHVSISSIPVRPSPSATSRLATEP